MKKILSVLLIISILFLSSCSSCETPSASICDDHVDVNDNGFCDTCDKYVVVLIDFYAINDLHGKLADSDNNQGVDELTTFLKNTQNTDDYTVMLSSGDMWQGSSESNMTKGLFATEWMNELDFVSMTLGNHEFDWGEEYIELNKNAAEFPFLAINIYNRGTNTPVDYCAPSVMVERGGLKIGIIGAIGDNYSSISADKVEDIYFKTGSELTALVRAESQKLREQGADYIVYSIHDGHDSSKNAVTDISELELSPYYDISLSDGCVDLVFEAHTHQRYVMKDRYGVYHLQNGGENKGISHVEVAVNYVSGSSAVNEAEFISSSEYADLEDDPIIGELLDKYADDIAKANRVLGNNARYRDGDELRNIVADLYYKKGLELWGDEYDIVLGGGFLSVRSPYNLQRGEVKYSVIQSIFPFDNELVLCSVKGKYLLSRFFENSNTNYFISYGEYGESVRKNIDPNATYYVVVDTYSSSYSWNNLTVVERYDKAVFARDLLAEFIEEGGLS